MSYILEPTELQKNGKIWIIKHPSFFHFSLFSHFSLSITIPCCRAHSDHVHPSHGRGRPAEWQGGHHLSGPPLLLRLPHLPEELFWRWLLPHSCATNETWHSKGGKSWNGALCIFVCIKAFNTVVALKVKWYIWVEGWIKYTAIIELLFG